MSRHHRSSPTASCFSRPSATDTTTTPNLTTSLYNTDAGLFALSWSRRRFGRSLHLQHHSLAAVHLHIKSFPWYHSKKGSKKLNLINTHKSATIFWDLTGAKYGSKPEPVSGFYVAVVVDGEIILLVGDSVKEAYSRTGATEKRDIQSPMILRREHVYGTKLYSTTANIGGRERNISIECRLGEDPRLLFSIDDNRVLEIKHLKWKFRGNESIEIDGNSVQISWDVYNWLFAGRHRRRRDHDHHEDGYALFLFAVLPQRISGSGQELQDCSNNINGLIQLWPHQFHHHEHSFGMGFEEKKMKKKKGFLVRRSGRLSSSSSSLSSANSSGSCSSSVMEWADREEDEFMSLPYNHGFSLLVYAWKN